MKGCKDFTSSKALMKTGIPSKKWSIPSFTAMPMSLCPITLAAALMTGANGIAMLSAVPIASPVDTNGVIFCQELFIRTKSVDTSIYNVTIMFLTVFYSIPRCG
jgi:hypothetical protein